MESVDTITAEVNQRGVNVGDRDGNKPSADADPHSRSNASPGSDACA